MNDFKDYDPNTPVFESTILELITDNCEHALGYYLDDSDGVNRCNACLQVVDPDEIDWRNEDGD